MRGSRVAQSLAVIACIIAFAALAALQVVGSLAVRADAARGSWVRSISANVARKVAALPASVPLDGTVRLVLARAAFARGDFAAARTQLATLAPSHDKLALEGQLALVAGDSVAAARDAARAHDLGTLGQVTDLLVARSDFARALTVQRAAIAQLRSDPTEGDALAEAQFRLGRLEEMTAWRYAVGSGVRRAHERASLDAYVRAAAAGPFVERYLLALAAQALDVGRYRLAEATYERARSVSPSSADPYAGLGDLALRRGDRPQAARELARAQRLNPDSAAVRRLAQA
ncbi:MAG: tetratricopeptide repeat protein, partial [Candidatus Eremiobacteraeota bacterium]|nr:tetratricopeptide repeat protein [Candidatus Eremiobacteraeota bacterium]